MCSYTTFAVNVDLCAHTYSKNGIFTRRVYSAYIFDSYPFPLLRRLTVGAAIEKNFFIFFYSRLDSCFDSVFQIILFNYFDSIKIRHLVLDFISQTPYRLNSHTSFRSILSRLRFLTSLLIFDSFLLASISTCFSIVDSTL